MVECNENESDSIRIESQKGVVKENHNGVSCDIKENKGDIDKLFHVANDEDGLIASKFNCSMHDNEKEITEFVAPIQSGHSSLTTKSFEDSVVHMDRSVIEHKLPELIVCYEENTYHVIKDICVDDGMPSQGKFLFDTAVDETALCSFLPLGKDINSGNPKERVDINMSVPEVVKSPAEREKVSLQLPIPDSDERGLQNGLPSDFGFNFPTLSGEAKDGATNAFKRILSLRDFLSMPELNTELSDFKSSIESTVEAKEQSLETPNEDTISAPTSARENASDEAISGKSLSVPTSEGSDHSHDEEAILATPIKNSATIEPDLDCQEADSVNNAAIPSVENLDTWDDVVKLSHALDSVPNESTNIITDKSSYNSKLATASIPFNFDSSAPTASKKLWSPQNINSEQSVTQQSLRPEDSNAMSVSSRLQYSHGESSFSATGPLSGLITYSGPIAYSGSLSLRSDSSTTSTRSFAFPILQSEWNSSPVRMAKADRKHRRWRVSFFCCRF